MGTTRVFTLPSAFSRACACRACTSSTGALHITFLITNLSRYLEHPAAFHGGACTCGCTTDWERCVVPPGASRVAREAQLRDPTLAAKASGSALSAECNHQPSLWAVSCI